MKRFVRAVAAVALVTWPTVASAKIVVDKMRPGQVFAVCHYLDTGHMQNDILTLFTDTGEVWFGDATGQRKSGRVIFYNDRLIAAQIVISGIERLYYFANILIDLESRKYLKSEINSNCSDAGKCWYEAVAFEGKCHQIFGNPVGNSQ